MLRGALRPTCLVLILFLALLPSFRFTENGNGDVEIPSRDGEVTFVNVTQEVGLSGVGGNFFSWGDYDHDTHMDLLVNGRRLFRNRGPPSYDFVEVTAETGITGSANSGVFADFDNDGWTDIFCGGGSGSSDHPGTLDVLWKNNGDGTFTDHTLEAGGVQDTFPTVASGWGDANRDGYPDLYMVNYENGSLKGYPDHFWMNNGDGTFTNMTGEFGLDESDHPYQGRGVSWSDFDNDGWQDLYVSNYRIMRNYLYRNQKGGFMSEIGEEKGVEGHGNVHPVTREGPYYGHSLGSVWSDFDNDLDMDLWVTNLAHKDAWRGPICDDSYLFRNDGPENNYSFTDVREGSGIPVKSIPGSLGGGDELMVSCSAADYDNDGDTDLFIPQIYNDISYAHSFMYRNDGGMQFTDVTESTGLKVWNTYGSAWCDYNEDGWPDLITGGGTWDGEDGETKHREVHLFENRGSGEDRKHWIQMDLMGRESGTNAIGGRVQLSVDSDGDGEWDLEQIREVSAGGGAHGQQDSHILHFGLGNSVEAISAKVIWPMGREVVLDDPQMDTRTRIFEPSEDIDVNLTLRDLQDTEEGLQATINMENGSPYPIKDRMYRIEIPDLETLRIVKRDRLGPGRTDLVPFTFEGESMESLYGEEIRVCLEWSYPEVVSEECFLKIVEEENSPPVPLLECPESVYVDQEVTFSGKRSHDPDGDSLSYIFYFGDGEDTGWTQSSTVTHIYGSPGEYMARLYLKDQRGMESLEYSQKMIEVMGEGEERPEATIISITPDDPYQGDEINFRGRGDPPVDEYITGYRWNSDRDGRLSSRQEFTTDDLSVGAHIIEFVVKASNGLWSEPDIRELRIDPEPVEELWVTVDRGSIPQVVTSDIILTGKAGPGDDVVAVQVKVGDRDWESAWSLPDWEYRVRSRGLSGAVDVIVRATDGLEYSKYSHLTLNFTEEGNDEEPTTRDEVSKPEGTRVLLMIGIPALVIVFFITFLLVFGVVSSMRRKRGG